MHFISWKVSTLLNKFPAEAASLCVFLKYISCVIPVSSKQNHPQIKNVSSFFLLKEKTPLMLAVFFFFPFGCSSSYYYYYYYHYLGQGKQGSVQLQNQSVFLWWLCRSLAGNQITLSKWPLWCLCIQVIMISSAVSRSTCLWYLTFPPNKCYLL